jgi:biotin-(acetyl-CoA carboxylase) ligase
MVLRQLRRLVLDCSNGEFDSVHAHINALWGPPRPVELDLDHGLVRGVFSGVNEDGALLLRDNHGQVTAYRAHEVRHVQELPKSTP